MSITRSLPAEPSASIKNLAQLFVAADRELPSGKSTLLANAGRCLMGRPIGPRKVYPYCVDFKLTAGKLTRVPGVQVQPARGVVRCPPRLRPALAVAR